MGYTLFLSPCVYLYTIHYCALPIEAEGAAADHGSIVVAHLASALFFDEEYQNLIGPTRRSTVDSPSTVSPSSSLSSSSSSSSSGEAGQPHVSAPFQPHPSPPFWSWAGVEAWGQSFDGALALSLAASAALNAAFGALAYAFFGDAAAAPTYRGGGAVPGCDTTRPFICDNIVKNVAAGPMQVFPVLPSFLCFSLKAESVRFCVMLLKYIYFSGHH